MAISQEEIQYLVQQLNSRERKARRLIIIASLISFMVGSSALAFLASRLNLAHYELTAHSQEINRLQNDLALTKSQSQEAKQSFLSEEQKYQADIGHLQNVLDKCQSANKSKVDTFQYALDVSRHKNVALTQVMEASNQENERLTRALRTANQENIKLTGALREAGTIVAGVRLEDPFKNYEAQLDEAYQRVESSLKKLSSVLKHSIGIGSIRQLYYDVQAINAELNNNPRNTLTSTNESKYSHNLQLSQEAQEDIKVIVGGSDDLLKDINSVKTDLASLSKFLIDAQESIKNSQRQLSTAREKLDKLLQNPVGSTQILIRTVDRKYISQVTQEHFRWFSRSHLTIGSSGGREASIKAQ
jgi:hypothetical protein